MFLKIKDDAVFVADSHYNEKNTEFLSFLKKLECGEIKATQLFLMGDMFDFISGESKYFITRNKQLLDLINELSKVMQIVYLEGNHDYNMANLFPNVLVVKRESQPLRAIYNGYNVDIAHGDIYTPWHYNLYCKIIRNHSLLVFLNMIDFNNFISKKIYYTLIKKQICFMMKDFKSFAQKRLKNYNSKIVIEGHFHQGKSFEENSQMYVNISSLCCEKSYFRLNKDFIKESL